MANKAWMLQRCYLASSIAFTLVFGICFASESEKQLSCEANEINNSILNINASKRKLGSAVEVLQGLELQNKQECKSKCCENPNCTVYISYDRPVGYNCFLVSCNPQDACVYRTLNGSVVGFRTVSEENVVETPKISEDFLKRTMTKEPIPTTSAEDESQDGVQSDPKGKDPNSAPQNVTQNKAAEPTNSGSANAATSVTQAPTAAVTTTPSALAHGKGVKDKNNHTTFASLIIALFFGILFLFAVILLIGRPWWDSFHRPRYSKVDYLMNGL